MHPDHIEVYYDNSDGSWVVSVENTSTKTEYVHLRSQSHVVVEAVLRAVEDDFWSHTRRMQLAYRRKESDIND